MFNLEEGLWNFYLHENLTDLKIDSNEGGIWIHKLIYLQYIDSDIIDLKDLLKLNYLNGTMFNKNDLNEFIRALYFHDFYTLHRLNHVSQHFFISPSKFFTPVDIESENNDSLIDYIEESDVTGGDDHLILESTDQHETISDEDDPNLIIKEKNSRKKKKNDKFYQRKPYQSHLDNPEILEKIFLALPNINNISKFARENNISQQTLDTWKSKNKQDPTWRPSRSNYSKS